MAFQEVENIWMNGKLIPWKDAKIHVLSHVIHYGSGVFEGIRCYNTSEGSAIFRLDEHLKRLFYSAKVYQMDVPYTYEEIQNAIIETIRDSGLKECYIRPLIYFGYSSLGVNPADCPVDVAIAVWPWGAYLGEEGLTQGIRVTISPWRKTHSSMLPTSVKACGPYANSFLAVRDASQKGFQEAILLNNQGDIAEGSGENVFLVKDNTIITNQAEASILLGITRDSVIQIARDLGYEVQLKQISIGELLGADELFFSGTAAEVTPIREVDGRQIGIGRMGPVTEKIQSTFFDIVNARSPRYEDWLTFIWND